MSSHPIFFCIVMLMIYVIIFTILEYFVFKKTTYNTVKPTGTVSMLPTSSGVEPVFELTYQRRLRLGGIDPAVNNSGEFVAITGESETAGLVSRRHMYEQLISEIGTTVGFSSRRLDPTYTPTVENNSYMYPEINLDFMNLYPQLRLGNEIDKPLVMSEGRLNYFKKIFSRENNVINCKTHKIAKQILFIADHLGYKWISNDGEEMVSYIKEDDQWDEFKELTCYDINEGTFDSIKNCLNVGCLILDGEELLNVEFNENGKRQIKLKRNG